MRRSVFVVVLAWLVVAGVANALEVRATPGAKVLVFGIPKQETECKVVNGNRLCSANIEIALAIVPRTGVLDIDVSKDQMSSSRQICAKIYGALDPPACGKPNVKKLSIR